MKNEINELLNECRTENPSYICMFYDVKEQKWYHSKRVEKKEAEYFMIKLLNSNDANITNVQVAKIIYEDKEV